MLKSCEKDALANVLALLYCTTCFRHLVKGIARAGGGTSDFATLQEDLRPKVMTQLKNALQPAISKVKVEWVGVDLNQDLSPKPKAQLETKKTLLGYMKPKPDIAVPTNGQAPLVLPPVYDGSRLLVYRLFGQEERPTAARVTAETPDGALEAEVMLEEAGLVEGNFVHQLAARKRIQDLEVIPAQSMT